MKIAFIGNQDNNAYRLCKWVRERGFDAQLFKMQHDVDVRSLPESVDRELKDGDPPWLHYYDDTHRLWFVRKSKIATRIEKDFNIVVSCGFNGLLGIKHFSRNIPLVHFSLGSEVTQFPLLLFYYKTCMKMQIYSFLARRSLSKVDRIITGYLPTMETIYKLKYYGKMRILGFPEDVKGNRARINTELLEKLNSRYCKYSRVFLWLSRLNFLKKNHEYKGSEKFLQAFKQIISEGHNVKAIIGTHGSDVKEFQQMITKEKLDSYVDYIPHLPFFELLTYLSIRNAVIFDELDREKGELSGLVREALSIGAVSVKTIDEGLVNMCYGPSCPVINAYDTQTCYDAMDKLLKYNSEQFEELKVKNYEWANKYLHYEKNVSKFLDILQEAMYCFKIGKSVKAV